MFIKKSIPIIIIAVITLFITQIEVFEEFEEHVQYRVGYLSLRVLGIIGNFLSYLRIVPKYELIRTVTNIFSNFQPNEEPIQIENKIFNEIDVRVYRPSEAEHSKLSLMIYFHGGAYFMGNLNFYDSFLSKIVKETKIGVISVKYRLAPEFPFPIPTDDCWKVVEHVLEHSEELNFDLNRLVLSGDSAGGNAAMVISKRLAKEKNVKPIFQVLIYPWTQLPFSHLPSLHMYKTGLLSTIHHSYLKLWYLGFAEVEEYMREMINSNNHTLLLSLTERETMRSYLDVNLIPEKYKKDKSYYKIFNLSNFSLINNGELDENSVLVKDKAFADKIRKMFSEEVSPGLASLEQLKFQPKTYEIICEIDSLKDEGLILGERLKQAGVEVQIAFYDQCFHGMVNFVDKYFGFSSSIKILEDLIKFIKNNI